MPDRIIEISDFSLGIMSDFYSGVPNTYSKTTASQWGGVDQQSQSVISDETFQSIKVPATIKGTYRCCADAAGALVALPRALDGPSLTMPSGGAAPSAHQAIYASDIINYSFDPVITADGLFDEIFLALTFIYDFGGGTNYRTFKQVKRWEFNAVEQSFSAKNDAMWAKSNTNTSTPKAHRHTQMSVSRQSVTGPPPTNNDDVYPFFVFVVPFDDNFATGAIAANELSYTTADAWSTNYTAVAATSANGLVYCYPDPDSTPNAESYYTFPSGTAVTQIANPGLLETHQGRVVVCCNPFKQVLGEGYFNEVLAYTPVLNVKGTIASLFYGEENPYRIGAICSLSADDLFVVRILGGGYVLRGDLNNPTVVRLPMIESTYGLQCDACPTPLGVVYGSRTGVYVWNGGQNSHHISPQIEGAFWYAQQDYQDSTPTDVCGGFEWWHPFIVTPNNYLFDTRNNSWWRLDNPATRYPWMDYCVSANRGSLFAIPIKYDASHLVAFNYFDRGVLASSYSWQSQPIIDTVLQQHSFKELILVATPQSANEHTCTVTVTLTGIREDGTTQDPIEVVFEFTNTNTQGEDNMATYPTLIRKTISPNFVAKYVQVRIEADSNVSTIAAPKIHRLQMVVADRQTVAKNV